MSSYNTARSSARSERRKRKFAGQSCLVCSITDPVVLVDTPTRKVSGRFLEQHHVVGKANGRATVPLCRNHHAWATESYLAAGIDMRPQPTLLHKILMVFRSLSEYSTMMSGSFAGWAESLASLIEQLDEEYPAWRAIEVTPVGSYDDNDDNYDIDDDDFDDDEEEDEYDDSDEEN